MNAHVLGDWEWQIKRGRLVLCTSEGQRKALFTSQGVTTFTCRSEALWGLDDDEATLLSFFCMLPSISQATLTSSACTNTQSETASPSHAKSHAPCTETK